MAGGILVDTSAWVEFLRGTGSETHSILRELLETRIESLVTTDVIVMELCAGARSEAHADELRAMLFGLQCIPTRGLEDYETAAQLYRSARRSGRTIRSLLDCIIASVALRQQLAVLHQDRDFEVLEQLAGLTLHRA